MTNVATHSANNNNEQCILNEASVSYPSIYPAPLGLLSTFCFPTSTCNAPKQQGFVALSSITVWTQSESYCELPHQRYEWKDAYTSGGVVNDWFFCLVSPRIFAGDDSTHSATASLAPAHHMMATRILTQNIPLGSRL